MAEYATVKLWGKTVGAVALNEGSEFAIFGYDRQFARDGFDVAPLTMPLSNRPYTFPELSVRTFHGLPGMLADSLPDKFGNRLIDTWLASQGRQLSG